MVRFGGPDNASIAAAASFENGLFISPFVEANRELQQFLIERYFTDGAALFGRESSEELNDFRRAAGLPAEFPEARSYEIVQYFVQRARNYAHIESLFEAEIEEARVCVEDQDPRCRVYEGKSIIVDACKRNLDWFRSLSQEQYLNEVFGKDWGFPPFHTLCRCRLEGVIEGVDYSDSLR